METNEQKKTHPTKSLGGLGELFQGVFFFCARIKMDKRSECTEKHGGVLLRNGGKWPGFLLLKSDPVGNHDWPQH